MKRLSRGALALLVALALLLVARAGGAVADAPSSETWGEYEQDRYILSEKNAAGESYRFEYDARGNRTKAIDPAGNEASWRYHADLPVEHSARDGHVTKYEHDGRGALVAASYPSGERYLVGYDAHGRVTEIADRDGVRLSFGYDSHHNLTSQTDARGATTRYWYDALGRAVLRQDGLGRVTRVSYDRLGRRSR